MTDGDIISCGGLGSSPPDRRDTNLGQESKNLRLSRISTLWSVVCQAHQAGTEEARPAQESLLNRYSGAVRRYLRAAVGDADAADDLFQEFAVRFLKGNLAGADAQRGRFRNFVKGVLFHLIADYHKRCKRSKQRRPLLAKLPEPMARPASLRDSEREFLTSWRDELLARAWVALEEVERREGRPWFTVLRFRADHPELRSPQLAEHLSASLNKPLSPAGVRQLLHRARDRFADLLLDEVMQSLADPSPDQVEQELTDLGLLEYCRPALTRPKP